MDTNTINRQLHTSLIIVGLISVAATVVYAVWFGLILQLPLSTDPGDWGAFGDYIGGIMNPLVAGCALYWLTMSVRLQKIELAATRSELSASRTAQETQANLAENSEERDILKMKLSALTEDLAYYQNRVHYWKQRADEGNTVEIGDDGHEVFPSFAYTYALQKVRSHSKMREKILIELGLYS